MTTLLDRANDIAEVIEANADDAERQRRLPAATVEALTAAGMMRMCVPAELGGPDADPMLFIETLAVLAHADGAAGWCAMVASTSSSMSAFLPPETARTIYADETVVTGGVFAPNGKGVAGSTPRGDGFVVDGRWAWGSGTQHSHWILGGTQCNDGTFRLCWFPRHDVTFHDTWYTSGMRGSGSLDYSVHGAAVPGEFTIQPGVTRPVVATALSRFPNFTLLAAAVAAVGLGIGRRALDELLDMAQGKTPQYSSKTLAESAYTHIEVARAEAHIRSARAFLLDELSVAWDIATSGAAVPVERRAAIRLAATHAAEVGAKVADVAYTLAGGTAVYDTSPLGRCQRDAHVVTNHIQTAPKLNETIGRLLLGQRVDSSML